eukprot:IDg13404t1
MFKNCTSETGGKGNVPLELKIDNKRQKSILKNLVTIYADIDEIDILKFENIAALPASTLETGTNADDDDDEGYSPP